MPNNYFRFKEFMIHQKACAMKVCTDSCVLGAYAASYLKQQNLQPQNILDVGGGTGLLSLMLAQKTNAYIDAVEIQEQCRQQMHENFQASPWKERLHSIHDDIRKWSTSKKYDFIISNPPFFEHDLKGNSIAKSMAMHDSGLLLNELINCIRSHISDTGNFCVMIPSSRQLFLESVFEANNACISLVLALKHCESKASFRLIYIGNFYSSSTESHTAELSIEKENGYTEDFRNLLRDYYLNL